MQRTLVVALLLSWPAVAASGLSPGHTGPLPASPASTALPGAITAPNATATPGTTAAAQSRPAVIDLWAEGTPAFGVFVPNERPRPSRGQGRGQRQPPLYTEEGGAELARNALYDFVFLNLEGGYDAGAVGAIAAGLRSGAAAGRGRPTLLVRIPPIARDGAEVTGSRVAEILAAGADGVVFPHVRGPEEALLAVSLMRAAGADLWSATNLDGDKIAMIMIEDPDALARLEEIAEVPGIGVLACGIGSLRGALDGDREAAEAGNQRVLEAARRIGAADMITANADDVEQRVGEGFLALLMQGAGADEAIEIGRHAAGR